jgi:hypothetical protein
MMMMMVAAREEDLPPICVGVYLSIFSSQAGPVFAVIVGQLLEQAP